MPFSATGVSSYSSPMFVDLDKDSEYDIVSGVFADVDNDGDYDLVIGRIFGKTNFAGGKFVLLK